MIDFESQVRAALARKEPGADFAAKVLARVERREEARAAAWHGWAASAIAASLLVGCWGAVDLGQQRERERGAAASAQLMKALAITSSQLQRIQKRVEGLN